MTAEAKSMLHRSPAARAVLRILGLAPLTTAQLAYLLRERYRPGTLRGVVVRLRLAGIVGWSGRRWRRAKLWRATG